MKKKSAIYLDSIIRRGDPEELKETLNTLSPFEIADLLSHYPEEFQSRIFGALDENLAKSTFDFLPVRMQRNLIPSLPSMQAAFLLKMLPPDKRTAYLQNLPQATVDAFLKTLTNEERILTQTLIGYPESSVGRLMTPNYVAIKMEWTVEEAMEHIQTYGPRSETINVVYVVNEEGKLLSELKINELLFASKKSFIRELAKNQFVALSVNEKEENAVNIFNKYFRVALPVIDEEENLLGIVTIDDILRISKQESTKDLQKIGGLAALDEPYLDAPLWELIKKRAGWLIVFFAGGSLTGVILAYYKDVIFHAVVLTFFIPLITSIGGNAGSQASALVVSAMLIGDVRENDWSRVIKREAISGLILGLIVGLIGFARISLFHVFSDLYGEHWFLLAQTVGITIICVVIWGSLFGALLPLCIRRLGFDPAISSAPFVSSLISVMSLVIYFLIALYLLKGTVL